MNGFFSNLILYRLPSPWQVDIAHLEAQLSNRRFMSCGSQDAESRGWVAPVADGPLVHGVGGQWLICLCIEQRLLPTSVVRQATEDRAAALESAQGFKPGRRQMKDMKEEVIRELMPHAFTTRRKVFAWIDPKSGCFGIDVASTNRAEDVLEALRQSLDAFPLTLLRTESSPVSAMADWLAGGEAPAGFTIDMDCELRSVTEDRAAVRYTHHALDGEEVRTHLTEGKRPTRLALTFDERISFVLTEKGEMKRLQFLDVVREQAEGDDAAELFDAQFALMTGELGRLIPAVIEALGGEASA